MNYPWLEDAWQRWVGYRQRQQIPHALLLNGAGGLGAASLALRFARSLHCSETSAEQPEACGDCKSCKQHVSESHPDLYWLTPPEGKKQIVVDQIRQAIHDLTLSTTAGGHRVLIIEPAEAMNWQAANSLLKTLEEPAANTLIQLICSEPQRLPATILSRCQQLPLPAPSAADSIAWLQQQQPELSDSDAGQLLDLGQGTPLAALTAFENEALQQHQRWRQEWMALVSNKADPVQIAEQLHKTHAKEYVRWLQLWSYSLARWLQDQQPRALLDGLTEQELAKLKQRLQPTEMLNYYQVCGRALGQLAGSANAQQLLERLLICWMAKYPPVIPAASLLAIR